MEERREDCTGASSSCTGDSSDSSGYCHYYYNAKEKDEERRGISMSSSSSSFFQRSSSFLSCIIVLALGGIGNLAGLGFATVDTMTLPVTSSLSKLEGFGTVVEGGSSLSDGGGGGGGGGSMTAEHAMLLRDRDYGRSLRHHGRVLSTTIVDFPHLGNDYEIGLETRTLRLGQERTQEKLPFRGGGKCMYELMDMKEANWYEVKISYPASTPAIFSIDLLPEYNEDPISSGRKLLNTEKIIFHLPKGQASQDLRSGMKRKVLVSVRPEGFVAQPYVQEQAFIMYNIHLEEVVLGIPLQAFWVGFLGLLAICAAILAARQIISRLQPLLQELAAKSSKRAL